MTVENRYRVLFAFLLDAGCRPSEAFGLKWSDIDFNSGRVTIQRTLQWHRKKEGGGPYFEETKTKTAGAQYRWPRERYNNCASTEASRLRRCSS